MDEDNQNVDGGNNGSGDSIPDGGVDSEGYKDVEFKKSHFAKQSEVKDGEYTEFIDVKLQAIINSDDTLEAVRQALHHELDRGINKMLRREHANMRKRAAELDQWTQQGLWDSL